MDVERLMDNYLYYVDLSYRLSRKRTEPLDERYQTHKKRGF